MTIESDFQDHLETKTSKTVYMNRAPEGASPPYIVQRLISKNNQGMGVTQARVQLDIFGEDPNGYGQAKAVAIDVTSAIHTASEDVADITASYRVSEMEMFDETVNYYRSVIDAMLYYDEREQFD